MTALAPARFAPRGTRTTSAIPYELYQLIRSRAITPLRWRKRRRRGPTRRGARPWRADQLIQRYGIAVAGRDDESALRPDQTDARSALATARATSACGHRPTLDRLGIDRRCSSCRGAELTRTSSRPPSGPHRRVARSWAGGIVTERLAAATIAVDGVVGASRGHGYRDSDDHRPTRRAPARSRRSVVVGHVDVDLVLGVHWWGLQTAPGRLDPVRDLLRGREWYAHSRGVLDGDPTHLGGRPGVSGGLAFEEPLRSNPLTAFYGIAARVIDRRLPAAAVIDRRTPALIADFVTRDIQASSRARPRRRRARSGARPRAPPRRRAGEPHGEVAHLSADHRGPHDDVATVAGSRSGLGGLIGLVNGGHMAMWPPSSLAGFAAGRDGSRASGRPTAEGVGEPRVRLAGGTPTESST